MAMKVAIKLGVAVFCAAALAGCESISFGSSLRSNANEIRVISRQQAGTCRLVSQIDGQSTFPPESDLYTAALEGVRAKAVEQSANALLVRSYEVQSGPSGSRANMKADIYVCPPEKAENSDLTQS
jgi:hypothetical protein